MNRYPRFAPLALLALAVLLSTAGCKSKLDQNAANQAGAQDSSADPASANLAPASTDASTQAPASSSAQQSAPPPASYNAPQQSASPPASYSDQQGAPPPDAGDNYNQASGQYSGDPGYGEQAAYTAPAPQPPPALPDYDQPEAPGDDYLWTPGYWAYTQEGYYWVPGVWVEAPYQGALWTPGYWGWYGGNYRFYRGYWGRHIGYYGGINYGFGYGGFGYQGGYWNHDHFAYNRAFNNVNESREHYVYNYNGGDRGGNRGGNRVSFNGGSGGIQVRARPAELAALHEQHAAPMSAQLQHEHMASTNRAQFATVNQGRPASMVVSRPLAADHNMRPRPLSNSSSNSSNNNSSNNNSNNSNSNSNNNSTSTTATAATTAAATTTAATTATATTTTATTATATTTATKHSNSTRRHPYSSTRPLSRSNSTSRLPNSSTRRLRIIRQLHSTRPPQNIRRWIIPSSRAGGPILAAYSSFAARVG